MHNQIPLLITAKGPAQGFQSSMSSDLGADCCQAGPAPSAAEVRAKTAAYTQWQQAMERKSRAIAPGGELILEVDPMHDFHAPVASS